MPTFTLIEKLYWSIRNSIYAIFHHMRIPALLCLIALLLYVLIYILKSEPSDKKVDFRHHINNIIRIVLPIFYYAMVLDITLINRVGTTIDPFSELLRGWSIFDTNLMMYLDLSPIENTILFIPNAFIIYILLKCKNKVDKNFVKKMTLVSFAMSIFIESMQIITHFGTIQFSDIFYNTFGGFIGAVLLMLITKKIHHKKSTKNEPEKIL